MVGRANLDGVNVLAAEDLAVVDVRSAPMRRAGRLILRVRLVDQSPRGFAATDLPFPVARAFAVHIAHGDDPHSLVAEERVDIVKALVAGPHHAQGDPITRSHRPPETERRARDHHRERKTGGRLSSPAQEVTARMS